MGIEGFLFDAPVYTALERNLEFQTKRMEAASSNIANMDTPDYRAVEVSFEERLSNEIRRVNPEIPVATDPRHFGLALMADRPVAITEASDRSMRVDGNSVDMDKELMSLATAQLEYSASITGLARKFSMLATAIQSRF